MKSGKCTIDSFAEVGMPEVLMLGRNKPSAAIRPLRRHTHRGAYEIFYLDSGSQVMGASHKGYLLRGKDLFITQADEIHSTGPHPMGKNLFYWLQIRADGPLFGLPAAESDEIHARLRAVPRPVIPGRSACKDLFEDLITLYPRALNDALARARLRSALLQLLLLVTTCIEDATPHACPDDILEVLDYIDRNMDLMPEVEQLAGLTGLSASRLRAKFRDAMGLPLQEYVLRRKIERAMYMLGQSPAITITDLAFDLGFSSSQYFATVFRKFTMQSPSAYRKALG